MDDEMEGVVPEAEVFDRFEVDRDYEFDAPKFFDLGREEALAEAYEVELWFEFSGSYPPSPLISKLFFEKDIQVANISTTSNLEDLEIKILHTDAFVAEVSMVSDIDRGCTYHNYEVQGVSEVDHKPACKKPLPKRSTLMKPTASQLAKQNRAGEVKSMSRFRNQLECRKEKGFIDVNDYTHQAAKRQRLEMGHCYKVIGTKHQIDLFHKGSEKHHFLDTKRNGLADTSNRLPRLKLTIPREPELKTARRALSLRTQQQKPDDSKCRVERMPPSFSTFKALPLNRKILEAPSLPLPQKTTPSLPKFKEFNFRTHNRSLAHNTSASSMNSDSHNPTFTGGVTSSIRIQPHESGIKAPKIEVRFEDLSVETEVHASGRVLPTLPNAIVNTVQILKFLQQLTRALDFTMVISLLQPAQETFELFDDIILLCERKIAYQGPREHVLKHFEWMGFKCPDRKNAADFSL